MKIERLASTFLMIGVLLLIGCGPSAGYYEKLLKNEAVDGGVLGAAPFIYNQEDGTASFSLLNFQLYSIREFSEVTVLKYGPIPGVSEGDIKSANVPSEDIFSGVPQDVVLSVYYESMGLNDPVAILAEVVIADMKPSGINPEIVGEITINREHLWKPTRIWFIGHQRIAQYEGEEDYYTVGVGCFEDLEYFRRLITIERKNKMKLNGGLNGLTF